MRYILQEGPRCAERDKTLSQQHNTQLLEELVKSKQPCTYGENTQR